MPAKDLTESTIATTLARARWGPTCFKCPHCGHDRGYHLAREPGRTFQCARCRRQKSVTADTVMHGTKIPLNVWAARAEWNDTGEVPSSRGFALEHGIASSSAWHLNQRFMVAMDLGQPKAIDFGGYLVLDGLMCRRPKPLRTPDETSGAVAEKSARFLEQRPPLVHQVVLGVGGWELVLVDACPAKETVDRLRCYPFHLHVQIKNEGIARWIASYLHGRFRTVCVRWLGAYVRHLLLTWNRRTGALARPAEWVVAVLASRWRSLGALRAAAGRLG